MCLSTASISFNPATLAPNGWTLFVPADSAFSTWPQYRKDDVSQDTNLAVKFISAHSLSQTVFTEPYKRQAVASGSSTSTDYTDLTGRTLTFTSYPQQLPNLPTYSITFNTQSADIVVADQLRSNGVIQSINNYILPSDWVWPKPNPTEFITQYSTFNTDVLIDLGLFGSSFLISQITADISNLIASGLVIPDGVSLFLIRNSIYSGFTNVDTDRLLLHIVEGAYTLADLPLDKELPTLNQTVRFVNYGGKTFLNGIAEITVSDIPLSGGTVFFVDQLLDLPTPDCAYCFKDTTLMDDLATIPEASGFYTLLQKNLLVLTPPYTMIIPSDFVGSFGEKNPAYDYLFTNDTAALEFIRNVTFPGFIYPTVAKGIFTYTAESLSGTTYTFVYSDPTTVSFQTDILPSGTTSYYPQPRKDAVYYLVRDVLFETYIPPPPPPDIAPITPSDSGEVPPGSAAYALNLCYSLLLLGLFVLFLIQ